MNGSPVISRLPVRVRSAEEPLFALSPVVLAKSALIAGMFAFCGVITGWLLVTFPGLR